MPEMIRSTDLFPDFGFEGLRTAGKRVWVTGTGSLTFPTMMVRCLEMSSGVTECEVSRRSVSLLAVRTTVQVGLLVGHCSMTGEENVRATHVYPTFRHCARTGAVLPPVAPKKAMLLGEDMIIVSCFPASFCE